MCGRSVSLFASPYSYSRYRIVRTLISSLNCIAIVIPCHRVVNKDGRLGGYGGGLRRKEHLLELERRSRAAKAG